MTDGKAYPRTGKMAALSDEQVKALRAGMATALGIEDDGISDDALTAIQIARAEYRQAYDAARNRDLADDYDEFARCCREAVARIDQILKGSNGNVIASQLLVSERIETDALVRHLNKVEGACQKLTRCLNDGERFDDETKFPGINHFVLSMRAVFDQLYGDLCYQGRKLKEQIRPAPFIQFLLLSFAGLPKEAQPAEGALVTAVRRALDK